MNAEKNIATVRKVIKAFNERDMSTIRDASTPNYVRHDLTGAFGERLGKEGAVDFLQLVIRAMPDNQLDIKDIFATENRVAAHYILSGTHQGELLGVPPTGKRITISIINLYRVEEDKIAEQWALMDVAGMLKQMGVLHV